MKRKISIIFISIISLVLILTFSLSGCKSTTAATTAVETTAAATTAETTAAATETTAPAEKINITSWVNPNMPDPVKKFVEGFNTAQDKYTDEYTQINEPFQATILNMWAAGQRPDVVNMFSPGGLRLLNAKENLMDLSDMGFVKRQTPGLLDITTKLDGVVYGPCIISGAGLGLMYNADVFAQAGITAPPKNYEELKAVCQKLKDAGFIPIFESGGDAWPAKFLVESLMADVLNKNNAFEPGGLIDKINHNQADFTDPMILDAVKKYKELQDLGYFNKDCATATWEQGMEAFMTGKAGFVNWGGTSIQGTLVGKYGVDQVNKVVRYMPFGTYEPVIVVQAGANWASWYIVKTDDQKKIEAAKEFVNYLSGEAPYEKYYQQFCDEYKIEPAFQGFTSPQVEQNLADGIKQMSEYPLCPYWDSYLIMSTETWYTSLAQMLAGALTPEQVCTKFSEDFKRLAKEAGIEEFQ